MAVDVETPTKGDNLLRHALYVVGVPGVGKSTLVSELTKGQYSVPQDQPVAHNVYATGVVELGKKKDGFPGTDTLSMTAITKVDPWVREEWWPHDYLLGEGDRLAVDRFFTALTEGGWELLIGYLFDTGVAAERRAQRAAALGTEPQKESWVKGRETKVERLVDRWDRYVCSIPANASLDEQVFALAAASPVAARLLGKETE